jgi:hypothetical protein
MAPHTKSLPPLLSFQIAMSAGTLVSSRFLEVHHHARLGRLLVVADIISEAYVVRHNVLLKEPAFSNNVHPVAMLRR